MSRKNWNPPQDEPTVTASAPACYSVEATAMRLGVCRDYVFKLIKDGTLASIKLGRRRLIPHVAIEALIASRMQ